MRGAATLNYGIFLNTCLEFLIVAFAVFLLVKQVNRLKGPAPVVVDTPRLPVLPEQDSAQGVALLRVHVRDQAGGIVMKRTASAALGTIAALSVMIAMAQSPAPADKFLTQPLVPGIYTADPSAHVFNGTIYIYPSHDIDAGRARRRSREPLRHARLSRLLA